MRFARIETADGPRPVVLRGETWAEIDDMFANELEFTGRDFVVDGARLLAPVIPTVLVGISHNLGNNDHPLPIQAFLKSPRTVVGTGAPVSYREGIGAINVEAELAIVIARNCRNISFDKAFDVVFGYTVANDVTNVGQVAIDEKFSQVKNGDGYTPLGPWIETTLHSPDSVALSVIRNGETVRSSSTSRLPSTLAQVIVYVTSWMSLGPGDVILTGAPETSIAIQPGATVEVAVAGIGSITNDVVREDIWWS